MTEHQANMILDLLKENAQRLERIEAVLLQQQQLSQQAVASVVGLLGVSDDDISSIIKAHR